MRADPTIIRGGERMFAHRSSEYKGHSIRVWAILALMALAVLGLTACGDEEEGTAGSTDAAAESDTSTTDSTDPTDSTSEDAPADTDDANPEDLRVIEDWSETLSTGDVAGAANYFATPSTAENGPILIEIEDREDAIAFNETLPCGASVISATSTGEFTTATFELSERPGTGGGCGPGVGGTASTSFVIEDGKIVEWRRIGDFAPSDGGDDGGSTV